MLCYKMWQLWTTKPLVKCKVVVSLQAHSMVLFKPSYLLVCFSYVLKAPGEDS